MRDSDGKLRLSENGRDYVWNECMGSFENDESGWDDIEVVHGIYI